MKLRESHEKRINCCREWLDCKKFHGDKQNKKKSERVIKWSNIFRFNHIAFKWKHTRTHTHFPRSVIPFRLLMHTRFYCTFQTNWLKICCHLSLHAHQKSIPVPDSFSFSSFLLIFSLSTHSKWNAKMPMHLCYNKKNLFLKIISREKKFRSVKRRSTKVKLRLKESAKP